MDDINFDLELQGNMKWSYEQFHICSLVFQQKIMVSKGSFPVREAMMDHQWDSIPRKNKPKFIDEWEEAEKHFIDSTDEKKTMKTNYERLRKKAQILADVLLEIKVINYAPSSEAEDIIKLGLEEINNDEEE